VNLNNKRGTNAKCKKLQEEKDKERKTGRVRKISRLRNTRPDQTRR
jgi:hypothetical protein